MFKKIMITAIAAVIFTAALDLSLSAEYLFLKDGSIVEGKITSDSADSVTIRSKDNQIKQIPRSKVLRILYTELYMGKVYVQKNDGKNIICFMVDEDRNSYTFRKELFSPEEFTLKREQVLFIARGNPTGLEGEVDTDSAELKWFPPYNSVKRYRIYIKGPEDKIFRFADETRSKTLTLKNLNSNTKYQLHVTAVDDAGDESIPSNELTITTKNLPPDKPVIISKEKTAKGDTRIIWNVSSDPDGKVAGYRVYKIIRENISLLTEIKKTEYTVPQNEVYDDISITCFDDLKAESDPAFCFDIHRRIYLSIIPSVLFPQGKFKDIAGIGYGVALKGDFAGYISTFIDAGIEVSFFYLPGKSQIIKRENYSEGMLLAPVKLSCGYIFKPFNIFTVTPQFSAGLCYINYSYSYFDIPSSVEKKINRSSLDPVVGIGLVLRYDFSDMLYVTFSSDYDLIIEKKENFQYITLGAGAGIRF